MTIFKMLAIVSLAILTACAEPEPRGVQYFAANLDEARDCLSSEHLAQIAALISGARASSWG